MLKIGRRVSETIFVISECGEITITVLGKLNGKVRLGLTSPSGTAIHTEKVYKKIQAAKAKLRDS